MAPIVHELINRKIRFKVCVTAQHREMLDQVLNFFQIVPDYDLNLMNSNQTLNSLSALILKKFDEILEVEEPDLVLVQGDTTTAFIAALGAYNRRIRIGHIEAGLRTNDLNSPFPEEGNRQLISRLAAMNFVPTESSKNNLVNEGISPEKIFLTGNTVVDSIEYGKQKLNEGFETEEIKRLKKILDPSHKLILVTGHRRESFGKGIDEICNAILKLSLINNVKILFPVHLNPQVHKKVFLKLSGRENIYLTPPLDYPTLLWALKMADHVISDSGGIQEEAPSFNKIVLVTRETSERMESIKEGYSILVGTDQNKIFKESQKLIMTRGLPPQFKNPYGDGNAALKIINFIIEYSESKN